MPIANGLVATAINVGAARRSAPPTVCNSDSDFLENKALENQSLTAPFQNKPCLHFKLGFFATQTTLVYTTNNACLKTD
jgi:hypothetical protein